MLYQRIGAPKEKKANGAQTRKQPEQLLKEG